MAASGSLKEVLIQEGRQESRVLTNIPPWTMVLAYLDYLTRTVSNLLRNAIRYAGAAGQLRFVRNGRGRWFGWWWKTKGPVFRAKIGVGIRAVLSTGCCALAGSRWCGSRFGDRQRVPGGMWRVGDLSEPQARRTCRDHSNSDGAWGRTMTIKND